MALCNPTQESVRPSDFQFQLREWRSLSKNPFKMGGGGWYFTLKKTYSHLFLWKLFWKLAICPKRSPYLLIVLVRSLRSARLGTGWLVKSVTYLTRSAKLVGVAVSSTCLHIFITITKQSKQTPAWFNGYTLLLNIMEIYEKDKAPTYVPIMQSGCNLPIFLECVVFAHWEWQELWKTLVTL